MKFSYCCIVGQICIISSLVVELNGYQNTGKPLQEFSRTRLMQIGQFVSQKQTLCGPNGGDMCSPNEKCCESNGLFGTCCPHATGICCGASNCCLTGRCCAGGCCEHTNGVCCYNYCCPAGQRCSGQNDNTCIPFGRDGSSAMKPGTSCFLLVVTNILMIASTAVISV